jgi:hypothetical protein
MISDAARAQRRKPKPAPGSSPGASTMLCAWQIDGDYWHVQSRDPWLSGVLLDMGMKRIARAIKGGHLHIFETDQGIEPVRPLLRRHKGRILR